MLITAKIKLRSPFLGDLRPDKLGVRRFQKQSGNIKTNTMAWQDQFQIAAGELRYPVDAKTIEPPRQFRAASLHLYRRIYSQVKMEMFESFQKGTVLTIDFRIKDDQEKAPDEIQFGAILRFTGERLGLSPFGSKFGFGLFDLVSLQPTENSRYE